MDPSSLEVGGLDVLHDGGTSVDMEPGQVMLLPYWALYPCRTINPALASWTFNFFIRKQRE
jgi:hypothetical protein